MKKEWFLALIIGVILGSGFTHFDYVNKEVPIAYPSYLNLDNGPAVEWQVIYCQPNKLDDSCYKKGLEKFTNLLRQIDKFKAEEALKTCKRSTESSLYYSATAICRDGTYSFSQNRSGTCSWHGGVYVWLK